MKGGKRNRLSPPPRGAGTQVWPSHASSHHAGRQADKEQAAPNCRPHGAWSPLSLAASGGSSSELVAIRVSPSRRQPSQRWSQLPSLGPRTRVCSALVIQLLTGWRHRSHITFPWAPGPTGCCGPREDVCHGGAEPQTGRAGWSLAGLAIRLADGKRRSRHGTCLSQTRRQDSSPGCWARSHLVPPWGPALRVWDPVG